MDNCLRRFDNCEIRESGLSEDLANRLASLRVDTDGMSTYEADNYARRTMADIFQSLWDVLEAANKGIRYSGYSKSEALISIASNLLELAEHETFADGAMPSLAVIGKAMFFDENGKAEEQAKHADD